MARKKINKEEAEETSAISVSDFRSISDDFVPDTQPVIVVESNDDFFMPSDEHRKKILELKQGVETNLLELCKLLHQVQKQNRNESWGYASFKDYAHRELGYKYARARMLADMGLLAYRDEGLFQKLTSVGIDKANEIKKIANSDNVDHWVDKAQHMNADDLKKEVKAAILALVPKDAEDALNMEGAASDTPVVDQLHHKTFAFTYENLQVVNQAIVNVKRANPYIKSDAEAIALACMEYVATNDSEGTGPDNAVRVIKNLERLQPISTVVVHRDESRILHGHAILQGLVEEALQQ